MEKFSSPVTELVEIPLRVPFEEFLNVFAAELEPVLLAQPGIISILTGMKIPTSDKDSFFAISLTQWETMDAHGAFLKSTSAGPFFERLQSLTSGSPTIEHYYLGRFKQPALKSTHSQVFKSDMLESRPQQTIFSRHVGACGQGTGAMGPCLEVETRKTLVLFGNQPLFDAAADIDNLDASLESYTVAWRRTGTGRISHSL